MGPADDARDAAVDEMEVDVGERHRDKERRERHRREEKDNHGSGRRDRGREKDKDDRRREKDESKHRDRDRERDREKDGKHRDRDKEVNCGRDRDRGKDRVRETERLRDKDRGKYRERESERDKERDPRDRDKERSRNRDKEKDRVERGEREKSKGHEGGQNAQVEVEQSSTAEFRERIARAKEKRLKDKKEGGILDDDDEASEILSWVGKSHKLDEKRKAEQEKALLFARALEEQDNILAENGDDDEEEEGKLDGDHLSGVKVLHGLDKVLEGGAVVMTLRDQSILADGDINEEGDMLENIETGEQKQRDGAYKAARKKGTYEDKFNEDSLSKKSILSHYDDLMDDEGVALDEGGRFTGEAERKLEEPRKRIEGGYIQKKTEDLTSTSKVSPDYFTLDKMDFFSKLTEKEKENLAQLMDIVSDRSKKMEEAWNVEETKILDVSCAYYRREIEKTLAEKKSAEDSSRMLEEEINELHLRKARIAASAMPDSE
ncbi:hypothetical protein EJB05_39655, partial [Eragrostis curvula]